MQKPQQRKYHSSCNRSVHRGTAHGKQEVKVCKRKTPHLLVRSFLSPYGDGTADLSEVTGATMFSPPYGDGTNSNRVEFRISVFAPLRGWYPHLNEPRAERLGVGTRNNEQHFNQIPFSPPYGDGTGYSSTTARHYKFSPPYGDGTLDAEKARLSTVVFAPLRG